MFNDIFFPANTLQKQLTQEELYNKSKNLASSIQVTNPHETEADSLLTRQQLLEVSQNISRYYAPAILSNTHTLVLLPIDPKNFYVYWNLADYHQYSDGQQQQQYDLKLRVFSQCKEYHPYKKAKLVYETTVSATQSRQKISLQKMQQGVVYTASLGKSLSKNSFIALVNSNEIYSLYETQKQRHFYSQSDDNSIETDLAQDINNIEKVSATTNRNELISVTINFASTNPSGQTNKK